MAIPKYDDFYRAVLEVLSDGELHNSKETIEHCAEVFQLSDEDRSAMLPSDRQTILANRVGWARTYLKKAGLITSPARGKYEITEAGKKAVQDTSINIDNDYLLGYKSFQDFIKTSQPADVVDSKSMQDDKEDAAESTPQEIMNTAYNRIKTQLADDLMTNIMAQDSTFFERLVMNLLEKMGYGGELANPGEVTGKTGDGGIDGIIRQDALGFDKIYVQAKRWSDDHPVGGPDIQQFAGALMGKGANKGLFITTSHFSKAAKDFVDKHMTAKIVLIDGKELTRLMIDYNLGVSTTYSYDIKKVDIDYFDDVNE